MFQVHGRSGAPIGYALPGPGGVTLRLTDEQYEAAKKDLGENRWRMVHPVFNCDVELYDDGVVEGVPPVGELTPEQLLSDSAPLTEEKKQEAQAKIAEDLAKLPVPEATPPPPAPPIEESNPPPKSRHKMTPAPAK
jgi:hypothetical protein